MATPVENFAKATVSAGYDAVATTIVLSTGHGSRFPSTFPFPIAWWNATDYSDPADDPNREIVICTNRAGDTLTVTRGGESTSASTKNTALKTYRMLAGITKAMWSELFTAPLSQSFRGLTVQTHPDSDKVLAQVRLIHADAIVMQDGQEILDWNDVDANLAGAGAGGLDTGSELASTTYEIHAIYNGATKNLMFHRAKDYFLDEDATAGEDASQGLRSAVDNSTVRIAQGFKVDTAGLVECVDVKLQNTGTPTGNYWFTIEANNGGVPSNTPLATSDKYAASRLTTAATMVRVIFRTPASLSAATQYHLVMYGDYAVSAANFVNWNMDGSAGAYANGSKALFDSDTSTWTTDTDDDMAFRCYVTRNDTAITMPSGYTQRALIGYAYNDGSSNLIPFTQIDKCVTGGDVASWKISTITSTTPLLVSLAHVVPPTAVKIVVKHHCTVGITAAMGNLAATDITSAFNGEQAGVVRSSIAANNTNPFPALNLSAYQACLYIVTAGSDQVYLSEFTW